MKGIQIVF